jgi:glutamine---fructose-6-phosphate transaminase (isomerizing)
MGRLSQMEQKNRLWEDIEAQEDNLKQVIEHLFTSERQNISDASSFLKNTKPTTLIGIGSAAYLCEPARALLQQNGLPASVIYASDALYNAIPSLKKTNVIINSRSGETVEIVKLGQALVEEGVPFVLITNEPNSTTAKLAKHVIWCNSRKDELVSINIVTSMMTATLILVSEIIGILKKITPSLSQLPITLGKVIQTSSERAEEIRDFFLETRPIYLLYRGADKGAAYCARLVLEEVARHPAIAMEAGEFRQGPIEVVDQSFGAVMFIPQGIQGELNLTLAQNILDNQGRVMLVGNCAQSFKPNQLVIPIPTTSNELLPVIGVVPVQILSYLLADSKGYNPGEVRYISKVITTEEGIPNQG